jgi:hypothetical protein
MQGAVNIQISHWLHTKWFPVTFKQSTKVSQCVYSSSVGSTSMSDSCPTLMCPSTYRPPFFRSFTKWISGHEDRGFPTKSSIWGLQNLTWSFRESSNSKYFRTWTEKQEIEHTLPLQLSTLPALTFPPEWVIPWQTHFPSALIKIVLVPVSTLSLLNFRNLVPLDLSASPVISLHVETVFQHGLLLSCLVYTSCSLQTLTVNRNLYWSWSFYY